MKKRSPNIIICMADQLRPFETACCDHPTVQTPAIQRMSEQGPWFDVACSNCPLCVPARSVLLTGQYARTCTGTTSNFVGFPPDRRRIVVRDETLPETLARAGYHNGLIGKWHVHPAPDLVGFHEAVYPHNQHRHYGQSFYDLAGHRWTVDGFAPTYELEQVQHFLRKNKDRPFFLQYNLSPPHYPLREAPERYLNRYTRDQVFLRENVFVDEEMARDEKWNAVYQWGYMAYLHDNMKGDEGPMSADYDQRKRERPQHGLKRFYQDVRRFMCDNPEAATSLKKAVPYLDLEKTAERDLVDLYRWYYGMVTCVDDCLGGLLDIIEEECIEEDTIVVFTSDHGDQLGSHHCWNKGYLYEESIRVPLLFRWPGELAPNRVRTQVASLVDLMPTLLALAGLSSPPTVQGEDLSPVLFGKEANVGANAAFIEAYQHRAVGVRTPTELYGIPMDGEKERRAEPRLDNPLHFDMRHDPEQVVNLAQGADPGNTEETLQRMLLRWHETTPWLDPDAELLQHSNKVQFG